MLNSALFSSDKMNWETPKSLFSELDAEFHFTLDAAASVDNHKCDKFFTVDDNSLAKSWKGETVFLNPPYGRDLSLWVAKAYRESMDSNTIVVLLIPSRTDTRYFHDYIYNKHEIRFIKGRLKFELNGEAMGSAPFPSMIVVMR